jgi:hypothetical protein
MRWHLERKLECELRSKLKIAPGFELLCPKPLLVTDAPDSPNSHD